MKNVLRTAGAMALAAGISFGVMAPANATIDYVGGGEWDHGVSASTTWSFYYHDSKAHRSSVQTSKAYQTSQWRGVGIWSIAQLTSTQSGNKTYYDYR